TASEKARIAPRNPLMRCAREDLIPHEASADKTGLLLSIVGRTFPGKPVDLVAEIAESLQARHDLAACIPCSRDAHQKIRRAASSDVDSEDPTQCDSGPWRRIVFPADKTRIPEHSLAATTLEVAHLRNAELKSPALCERRG